MSEKTIPWIKLENLLIDKKVGRAFLEENLPYSSTRISNWKNRGIPAKEAPVLADLFRVSTDYFLRDVGDLKSGAFDIDKGNSTDTIYFNPGVFSALKASPFVCINQYHNAAGSMGVGIILRDQPGEITSLQVTPEWITKNIKNYTSVSNLCIVTGFGDSMQPMFNSGDPLLVDSGVKSVDFDAVYFFRVGNEGFIKRLQRIPGEGLYALSENSKYREWIIKEGMDFEVFGRVIKVWCGADF